MKPAAGMGGRATHVHLLQRHPVLPITREWSIEKELIYCELALKDIALGETNFVFNLMWRSHFGVHHKILKSWRVAFNLVDDGSPKGIALLGVHSPSASFGGQYWINVDIQ